MKLATALLLAASPALAQSEAQLQAACKDFVEQSLHDPRGADLSQWTKGRIAKAGKDRFTVTFPGRAANRYGALRRSIFQCTIRYTAPDDFAGKVTVQELP